MARIERSKQMAESQNGVTTDAITALIAAILALANALDKKKALSFEEYRDALLSMYRQMPHEDASGDACVYRKLKPAHSGDAARQGSHLM
jgi:hypothetical protein